MFGDRPRHLVPILGGLWLIAFAAKWPILGVPAYWDEGLHYWTAKHLGQGYAAITGLWGIPLGAPTALVFQRPAFYLAFALPAQFGFEAFRVAHAFAASVMAPLAYLLLRAHGSPRWAGVVAGLAVATVPPLVLWGNLGLMDSLMTSAVAAILIVRTTPRHLLLSILCVVAVWIKETAYFAVLVLLGIEVVKGLRDRTASLWPIRMGPRLSAISWAAALAPLPLLWAMAHDLPLPGTQNHDLPLALLDRVLLSPWLVAIIASGLAFVRVRPLSIAALTGAAFLLALQLAARDVPQWYEVPTTFLAIVAAVASAHAVAKFLWKSRWRVAGWAPGAATLAILMAAVLVPAGSGRELLHPISGDGGDSLPGIWNFEQNIRDRDLHSTIAAIPLATHPDVFALDLAPPALYVPIVEQAQKAWWDSTSIRAYLPLDVPSVAHRMEANHTWTLIEANGKPLTIAIQQTYADCRTHASARYELFEAGPCAGRAAQLEAAWRAADPNF